MSTVTKNLHSLFSKGCYNFTSSDIRHFDQNELITAVFSIPDLIDYSKRSYVHSSVISNEGNQNACKISTTQSMDDKLKGEVYCTRTGLRLCFTGGGYGTGGSDKNSVYLEIWKGEEELIRIQIPDCRDVYLNGSFGCPRFLLDGKSVVFVGEKADEKFPRGYWAENKDGQDPADKFKYTPDYGETMGQIRKPRLFLFNFILKSWKVIDVPDYDVAFPLPIPIKDERDCSIVVVGYRRRSRYRLPGLSVCSNRESCLLLIQDPWEAVLRYTNLTSGIFMVGSAALANATNELVFVGSEKPFFSHSTELDVFVLNYLATNPVARKLSFPKAVTYDAPAPVFSGVYMLTQAEAGQLRVLPDNDHIILQSYTFGKSGIFVLNIREPRVVKSISPPVESGESSVMLLSSHGYEVVFLHQGYLNPRTLWHARLDPDDLSSVCYVKLFSAPLLRTMQADLPWFANATVSTIKTAHCSAWLLRSGCPRDGDYPRPLIALFHGGPHALALTTFSPEIANYLASGYDVVLPNYRGSIGFGRDFLDCLIGQAGTLDVQDCHDCVLEAKKLLNPSVIIAVGGSHGGFITAWLLGHPHFKSEYAAGVLWNPASDIVSMSLGSDIPEWALSQVFNSAECGAESSVAPSPEFFRRALAQSPMSVVKNVDVPVLVILGASDKRVVPNAGLRWSQAVEENSKASSAHVDVLWFPDQGHAIAGPEYNETATVAKAIWIENKVRDALQRANS
jgi:acetyl esterase/lipase